MIFIFINCYHVSSDVDSWWQVWKIFDWNFHVTTKVETHAKFELSRLILIFISCQQLLSAVDRWLAVENYFWELDSHIGPKTGFCAKFRIDWLIGSRARECDTNRQTPSEDRANAALLSWARVWVGQYNWKHFLANLSLGLTADTNYFPVDMTQCVNGVLLFKLCQFISTKHRCSRLIYVAWITIMSSSF